VTDITVETQTQLEDRYSNREQSTARGSRSERSGSSSLVDCYCYRCFDGLSVPIFKEKQSLGLLILQQHCC